MRLITFSDFDAHSNPIFSKLKMIKFPDLVYFQNVVFMYNFYSGNLPVIFNNFFLPVNQRHNYSTRLSARSSYSIPKIRTNYGKFNIRYIGAKVWNSIDESQKV